MIKKLDMVEWQQHIDDWWKSKLPQRVFCEQRGLNYNSFSYARSKLRRSNNTAIRFNPVKVTQPESPPPQVKGSFDVRVNLANGLNIELSQVPLDQLSAVVGAIGGVHA